MRRRKLTAVVFLLVALLQATVFHVESGGSPPVAISERVQQQVWNALRDDLSVHAVGIGPGGSIVVVADETFSEEKLPMLPESYPAFYEVLTSDRVTISLAGGDDGDWVVNDGGVEVNLRARMRPARGGVSIGHYGITAGTFGAVVCDRSTGKSMILSNNHVLARTNESMIGDPIVQPGAYDRGRLPGDRIGTLARFVPLRANTDNIVDAAVAWPDDEKLISQESVLIGKITGWKDAKPGDRVRKIGRTTGYQEGKVLAVGVSVRVWYDRKTAFEFADQLMIDDHLTKPGDSGSLLVDAYSQNAVGLIFAGGPYGFANPIGQVLSGLNVDICREPEGKMVMIMLLKLVK